jgi:hypothetical protein
MEINEHSNNLKKNYNIFMFIYEELQNSSSSLVLIQNVSEIIKNFNSKKNSENVNISYEYYKQFNIQTIRYIYDILFNIKNVTIDDLKIYIPKYKILLCKTEYKSYGIHRHGWVKVIDEFLKINYTESDDFNYENPNFEWVQYAIKFNLSSYKDTVEHFNNNLNPPLIDTYKINCIIFDDWLEKTYGWGDKKNKKKYNINFISFLHDPPTENLKDYTFSKFMEGKIKTMDVYNDELFIKEKKELKILITLSTSHKDFIVSKNIYKSNIYCLHHPLNNCIDTETEFSFDKYTTNQYKKIYMIGWWLRKFDTFINLKNKLHDKIILIKQNEGKHVVDYTLYEIRKTITPESADNTRDQTELSDDELAILKTNYNTSICNFLSNNKYDEIFIKNIVFLDFYSTSANNVILECISLNTPVLVNSNEATINYLGKDYPFYYNSLEEAENKLNNIDLIRETNNYLKNMDKSNLSYESFNNKLSNIINESFSK